MKTKLPQPVQAPELRWAQRIATEQGLGAAKRGRLTRSERAQSSAGGGDDDGGSEGSQGGCARVAGGEGGWRSCGAESGNERWQQRPGPDGRAASDGEGGNIQCSVNASV